MKEKSMGPTTTVALSISSSTINNKCDDVIDTLKHLGIMANVTANRTILKASHTSLEKTNEYQEETGCRIIFGIPSNKEPHREIKKIWDKLKLNHSLDCAHVSIDLNWSGCIYNFLRPSICPGQ